jgi:hypothetical protein
MTIKHAPLLGGSLLQISPHENDAVLMMPCVETGVAGAVVLYAASRFVFSGLWR